MRLSIGKFQTAVRRRSHDGCASTIILCRRGASTARFGLMAMLTVVFLQSPLAHADDPAVTIDLANTDPDQVELQRVAGSVGNGAFGVPVTGGVDCDGDGNLDTAFGAMRASPLGRSLAGLVYLIFGNGQIGGTIDTAVESSQVLEILGDGNSETTGDEIWMADVTGDGIGDLLIGRQNFTPDSQRIGAGALSIVVGGEELRTLAQSLDPLDLRDVANAVTVTTLVGPSAFDRLGIWMRTGDVTGDGIADFVVGADQSSSPNETHHGAVYVVRGGSHLASGGQFDLAALENTALEEHVIRVDPPSNSSHHHFGATCQIADLDGNGRSEVLVAAALDRAGAVIRADGASIGTAHGSGGAPRGWLYIAWDDNFDSDPWTADDSFVMTDGPGSHSLLKGGEGNRRFGEEILGGLDYDLDGHADLYIGDIVGNVSGEIGRSSSGSGHVIYQAALLKGLEIQIDEPPMSLDTVTILGAAFGDIAGDTAAHGDFDGDGIADLAVASPHGIPLNRTKAGFIHILHGREGRWPERIDFADLPAGSEVRISLIQGARGEMAPSDSGDTLGYSAAAADLDGDGRVDLITNEMLGNGVSPNTEDVGNLIIVSGGLMGRNDARIVIVVRPRPGIPTMVEVFVLGSQTLDVNTIDVGSLRLGSTRAKPAPIDAPAAQIRDANRDGHDDLLVRFSPDDVPSLQAGVRLCLVGLAEERAFRACAPVRRISPSPLPRRRRRF